MTDKELLELAARAAGYVEIDFLGFDVDGYANVYDADGKHYIWKPLTDDGDALRLAVKLGLTITIDIGLGHETEAYEYAKPEFFSQVDHNDDPFAATRRAIVRAAAEIGKGMK